VYTEQDKNILIFCSFIVSALQCFLINLMQKVKKWEWVKCGAN